MSHPPASDPAMTALRIRLRRTEPGVVHLHVAGEVDIETVDALDEAIRTALDADDLTRLVVHLDRTTFLASVGILVLLAGHRRATERQVGFGVENPSGIVRRVLEITGVLDHLTEPSGPSVRRGMTA